MSLYDKINVGFGAGFGSKVGKLYSVKPTDGSADFDCLRTGESTSINDQGLIVPFVADKPRDYNDGVGCSVLLTEPASTNLALYSEDFNNAAWTKNGFIISSDSEISPSGILNADNVTETAVNEIHRTFQTVGGLTISDEYIFSVYFKTSGRTSGNIILTSGANANFDFLTKETSNTSIIKFNDFGNGWVRVSFLFTATLTSETIQIQMTASRGSSSTYLGDGVSGWYLWGAQLEQLSYPTTYIPTTANAVLREADSALGEVDSKNYQSSGILFVHTAAINEDTVLKLISISDGGLTNRAAIRYDNTLNKIRFQVYQNNALQADINAQMDNLADYNKFAFYFNVDNFQIWANGLKVAETLSGNLPLGLNNLQFAQGNGGNPFLGYTAELWYSPDTDINVENYTAYDDFDDLIKWFKYDKQ